MCVCVCVCVMLSRRYTRLIRVCGNIVMIVTTVKLIQQRSNYRHSCVACHGPHAPLSLRAYFVFFLYILLFFFFLYFWLSPIQIPRCCRRESSPPGCCQVCGENEVIFLVCLTLSEFTSRAVRQAAHHFGSGVQTKSLRAN